MISIDGLTVEFGVKPLFKDVSFVINFDDPRKSHRCNPINPSFMTDISDAYESAYTIMLNLNRSWIQKQGDFFVESPIILFAAIIWFLKLSTQLLCPRWFYLYTHSYDCYLLIR